MSGAHAEGKSRTPGLGAAWAVLTGCLVTSVAYNVVHATQGARLQIALALLLGFMPAFIAACLSHVAAVLDAPQWVIVSVIAVMGAGMVLSASATAAVVAPADPSWRGWLFGGTLDAGALLALWAIMASRRRKNEAAMAVEAAHAEVATARTEAARAVQGAREQAAAAEGERSRLAEELAAVRAELDRAREAVQKGGPAKRSSGPGKAVRTAPVDDVAIEARALELLATDLDMSGAELARRLKVTPGYGRKLRRRLTDPDRPRTGGPDREGQRSQDR